MTQQLPQGAKLRLRSFKGVWVCTLQEDNRRPLSLKSWPKYAVARTPAQALNKWQQKYLGA